jgi:hypothetical protein
MRRRKITTMVTPMLDRAIMVMLTQVTVTLMVRLKENQAPRRGR